MVIDKITEVAILWPNENAQGHFKVRKSHCKQTLFRRKALASKKNDEEVHFATCYRSADRNWILKKEPAHTERWYISAEPYWLTMYKKTRTPCQIFSASE